MKPPLTDETWQHRGVSTLWDAAALHRLGPDPGAVSVRGFLRLHEAGWPADDPRLTPGRPLVVAGLEAALDTLEPEAAEEWMRETFYAAVRGYQGDVASGGSEAALIVWLAVGRRIETERATSSFAWLGEGRHHGRRLPFGALLWNGAQADVREIHTPGPGGIVVAGLFCARIS